MHASFDFFELSNGLTSL